MAKRASPDESPFRPLLDTGLLAAAMAQVPPRSTPDSGIPPEQGDSNRIVDLPRSEPVRAGQGLRRVGREENLTQPEAVPSRQAMQPAPQKFDHEKRILFTRSETQSIDRLVTSLARRLNAQVKVSHLVRALVVLLLNAEGEVDKRAGEAMPLVRPPNGDAQALQRFEREIAKIIAAALRDSPPLRIT